MSIPANFNQAYTFLGKRAARNVKGKQSTKVVRLDPDTIALRYHGTSVVTWHADGRITLRSNGWHTVTTKRRINQGAPVTVYQEKFLWYVDTAERKRVPFEEGMVV
jgi:hypothetical protein